MLSWSGQEYGVAVELATLSVGVATADALVAFARAATSPAADADVLSSTRDRLVEVMGVDAMVDAAAVVANFEMMTRLADSTGAVLNNPASIKAGGAVGADAFASKH
mgnify:FL=1